MKLTTQKNLAAKIFGVGTGKIWFDPLRLSDIQQAITREDIKGLVKDRAIRLKYAPKRRKQLPKKRRGMQSRRMRPKTQKRDYMNKIRKMRRFLNEAHAKGEVSKESKEKLRRWAKSGQFRSLRHMKEAMKTLGVGVKK